MLFYFLLVYAIFKPRTIKSERNWVIQVISVSKLLWKQRIIDGASDCSMMVLIQSLVILFGVYLCSRSHDSLVAFNFFIYVCRGGFFMIFLFSPPCLLVTAFDYFYTLWFPFPVELVEETPLIDALLAHLHRLVPVLLLQAWNQERDRWVSTSLPQKYLFLIHA